MISDRLDRRTFLSLPLGLILPANAATTTFRDKLGRTVHIPAPVHRAVALQLYEFFPALHCWDNIAGVGRYVYDNDLVKAAFPAIARHIPEIGSASDINIEALLKLNPDVVLTWTYYPDQIRFMEQRGLNVVGLYLDSVREVYEAIDLMGRLFGHEREAKATAGRMERVFTLVRQRSGAIPPQARRKVLWLYSSPNQVGGPADLTGDMIARIGATNTAAELAGRTPAVSMERIVAWNPDVVIVWGSARYNTSEVLANPQWRFVKAVRNNMVYKAPKWSTWSPRLALTVLWMAMKVYPERYADIRLLAIAEQFYQEVFGIPFRPVMVNDF